MAYEETTGGNMVMPVGPMGNNGGFGNFGGDGWWILLLFILLGNGNWGMNGMGGMGGMYPWMNQANQMTDGFQNQMLNTSLNGIQQGLTNGFAQAEISANARQMADMQQNFSIQSALQQCCCDNRAATADLKYTMATEAALTRQNCDQNNQKVLDKLCQLELDGVRQNYEAQIRDMQNQLNRANSENQSLRFSASQGAQTARILSDNAAQTTALEQYLAPTPRPAYVVQNPNCCQQGMNGCGNF